MFVLTGNSPIRYLTLSVDTTSTALEGSEWDQSFEGSSELTNPLSAGPSTFMTAENGQICMLKIYLTVESQLTKGVYLGTSSNWSFARKVLGMLHEHVYHSPLPTGSLLFDESAYDLDWDGSRTTVSPEIPMTPTLDFSIYLINAVKFHAGQLYHLFDEKAFMENLYAFHENPAHYMGTSSLWYIHYLLLLAFGKAFVVQRNHGPRPAGCEFFIKALQLLPDMTRLSRDPLISTEILCCIALYLQSLDFRSTAYSYVCPSFQLWLVAICLIRYRLAKLCELHLHMGCIQICPLSDLDRSPSGDVARSGGQCTFLTGR